MNESVKKYLSWVFVKMSFATCRQLCAASNILSGLAFVGTVSSTSFLISTVVMPLLPHHCYGSADTIYDTSIVEYVTYLLGQMCDYEFDTCGIFY